MKAVILAGGVGTRLWPVSRMKKPKQLHKLTGTKTMLQETLKRISFLKKNDIYIATNKEFVKETTKQLPKFPKKNIIIEPALRDTATCIGYAATLLSINHPHEVMAIIYADHIVKDAKQFKRKLQTAEKAAKKYNSLNIIEVKARFPNVNLGWVKVGKRIDTIDGNIILELKAFTEKPDYKKALSFIKSKNYLWNTGMYVWKINTILDKYKKHLPDTYNKLMKIKASVGTKKEKSVIEKEYSACQKISVDYAIMEKVKTTEVKIIPADFGWSDVGTWESIHDELSKNKSNNIIFGKHLIIDTKGSVIRNDNPKKIIATIGLENIAVIDTKDALLICPLSRSQDVKKIVEMLKDSKKYL
ncbi:mannose-1-phosphate guanylyltransferase [Candidatus Peregrinibacteria bacterium]|nr:mannose-1-phosphate guanylyltransferase [Candidatus Peregrinibacteria bacterium]